MIGPIGGTRRVASCVSRRTAVSKVKLGERTISIGIGGLKQQKIDSNCKFRQLLPRPLWRQLLL
jgi:hypothetical protein